MPRTTTSLLCILLLIPSIIASLHRSTPRQFNRRLIQDYVPNHPQLDRRLNIGPSTPELGAAVDRREAEIIQNACLLPPRSDGKRRRAIIIQNGNDCLSSTSAPVASTSIPDVTVLASTSTSTSSAASTSSSSTSPTTASTAPTIVSVADASSYTSTSAAAVSSTSTSSTSSTATSSSTVRVVVKQQCVYISRQRHLTPEEMKKKLKKGEL
ncbi:MAG: hypothetical protein M1824_002064 [Vezdaea acicularis]|nr:MAG: hypothetical protein M1824_002064 [Vezdaea acicularis]